MLAAVALCMAAGGATDWVLASGSTCQAHAIVGFTDASATPGVEDADREPSAAVLARASEHLRAIGWAKAETPWVQRLAGAIGLAKAASPDAASATQAFDTQAFDTHPIATKTIATHPGPTPDTITIEARDAMAERAAATATAVAEAFVGDRNEAAVSRRRARDTANAARLRTLTEAAETARRHLADVGDTGADPAADAAAAARDSARAKARVEAFRTVIAASSPPLGAPAGLPPSIAPLQATYLEIKRQLIDAKGTLGDRHTTVIGLEDGLRQAAKTLTAEWKRLTAVAETEWKLARDREANLAKVNAARDPASRQAIEEARDAVKAADEATIGFQEAVATAPIEDRRYRLVAAAGVPMAPTGLPALFRAAASVAAGLIAAGLVLAPSWRPSFNEEAQAPDAAREAPRPATLSAAERAAEPLQHDDVPLDDGPLACEAEDKAEREDDDGFKIEDEDEALDELEIAIEPDVLDRPNRRHAAAAQSPRRSAPEPTPALARQRTARAPRDLDHAPTATPLGDVVEELARVEARPGLPATVFVGSMEQGTATTMVTLALARAAAETGARVLLVEGRRDRSVLAAAIPPEGQPVVVDILGALKIALRDADVEGVVYLAPAFPDGKRLAAGLARSGDVPFIADAAAAFDLVLVDGGAVDAGVAAEAWAEVADASLRVGRTPSRADDEAFLAAIGGTYATFVGAITGAAATRDGAPRAETVPDAETLPRARPRLAVDNATPQAPRERMVAATTSATRRRARIR
jgi:Mrp family chromosome partitioning ATPase